MRRPAIPRTRSPTRESVFAQDALHPAADSFLQPASALICDSFTISSHIVCRVHRKEIDSTSKTTELTSEHYLTQESIAARDDETPQHFIERLLDALVQPHGTIYYTDDGLLRALGADD
jgi:hypothetical protein